ncbi:unnamed protein product [Brassica rapa subsp. trilocularis]
MSRLPLMENTPASELTPTRLGFPTEFPYEFDSPAFTSPGDSTDESSDDEEDFLAGLSRRLAPSTQRLPPPSSEVKRNVAATSPQSTLSGLGSYSTSGSRSPVLPPPSHTTSFRRDDVLDVISAAAGEVARLKLGSHEPHHLPRQNAAFQTDRYIQQQRLLLHQMWLSSQSRIKNSENLRHMKHNALVANAALMRQHAGTPLKRPSTGTGVFLPRRYPATTTPSEPIKKPVPVVNTAAMLQSKVNFDEFINVKSRQSQFDYDGYSRLFTGDFVWLNESATLWSQANNNNLGNSLLTTEEGGGEEERQRLLAAETQEEPFVVTTMNATEAMNCKVNVRGDDVDIEIPDTAHQISSDSWFQVAFVLTTGINSAYVLGYSGTVMVPLGWVGGMVGLLLATVISLYANTLVAKLHEFGGKRHIRYRDLAGFIYGRKAYHLTWGLQYVNLFMINCGFIILAGSALKAVYVLFRDDHTIKLPHCIAIAGLICAVFAIGIPHLSALGVWLAVSTILSLIYIVVAIVLSVRDGVNLQEITR